MPDFVERMTRIGNEAVRRAQLENWKKGLPNVYSINGTIIWQFPDGSITTTDPFAKTSTAPASSSATRSTEFRK